VTTVNTKKLVLARVAELAGVSAPTVSKVINGRYSVAAETRARVQAALDHLGYESPSQRRIQPQGPTMVDLVIDGTNSQYALEILTGILDYSAEVECEVTVRNMTEARLQRADHDALAERMRASARKGLILAATVVTPQLIEPYRRRNLPVVVIDPRNVPPSGCVAVGASNWAGGKSATAHLLDLGHERIAFIGGPEDVEQSIARLHGYLAALRSRGISARNEYILAGEFGRVFGAEGARRLLDLPEPPTAIFAVCDFTALGVLEECRRRGLSVPDELSVVGFDGLALVEQTIPRLTSVSQPLKEMGRAALRSLLHLAHGQPLDSDYVEFATELVVRGSTAAPLNNHLD